MYSLLWWLCMKRKFILLLLLISGLNTTRKWHICVFWLTSSKSEIIVGWRCLSLQCVCETNVTLCAMIFCTINDFPTYGNLSRYTVKWPKVCPICDEDMIDERLCHCGKNVYLDCRTWLPLDHPFRKRKNCSMWMLRWEKPIYLYVEKRFISE